MTARTRQGRFRKERRPPSASRLTWLIAAIASGMIGSYLLLATHADTPPVTGQSSSAPPSGNVTDYTRAAYKGYLYIIATPLSYQPGNETYPGYVTSDHPGAIYYARTNPDGSVGSWLQTTSLPVPPNSTSTLEMPAVAYNGYLYVLDPKNNATYAAPINSNGSLGSWSTKAAFPAACRADSSNSPTTILANRGTLYVYGSTGEVGTAFCYARIGANGSLSSWMTTTAAPVNSHNGRPAFTIVNNYIYSAGQRQPNDTPTNRTTYFAAINADGSLGAWQTTTALPISVVGIQTDGNGIYSGSVFATTQYLYVLGWVADPGGGTHVYTFYAPFTSGGQIGAWHAVATPKISSYPIVTNGHMYSFGSTDTRPGHLSTVYSAGLVGATDTDGPSGPASPGGGSGGASGGTGTGSGSQGSGGGTGTGAAAKSSGGSASAGSDTAAGSATPTSSAQGTQTKQTSPRPNPFYDGKQYGPGSDADTVARAAAKRRASYRWLLLALAVVLSLICGFVVWRRQRPAPRKF